MFIIAESKMEGMTRDVGTQSTPPDLSSASPSPASTPSIMEGSSKRCEAEASGDSPNSNAKIKSEEEVCIVFFINNFIYSIVKYKHPERSRATRQTKHYLIINYSDGAFTFYPI